MMKQECAVVQDLFVLYEDDVLSSESRKMVKEHIKTCAECRKVYEKMSVPLSDIQETLPGVKKILGKSEKDWEDMAVKAVSRLRRKLAFEHIIAAGLLLIVFILVTSLVEHFTAAGRIGSIFTSMPAEEIDVKEIYRLKNGEIYMVLSSEKGFYVSEKPILESLPYSQPQDTDEAYYRIGFEKSYGWLAKLQDPVSVKEAAYIFSTEKELCNYMTKEVYQWNCSEISYFGAFKSDKKILWEQGQDVPEAPQKIEKAAIAAYVKNGDFKKAQEELERNEDLRDLNIYDIYDECYSDDESAPYYADWWWAEREACEVYMQLDD